MLTSGNKCRGQQNPYPTPPQDDSMAKLKKLKEIFELDLITAEGFAAKKQELLNLI